MRNVTSFGLGDFGLIADRHVDTQIRHSARLGGSTTSLRENTSNKIPRASLR
jgi:hypothetical protein